MLRTELLDAFKEMSKEERAAFRTEIFQPGDFGMGPATASSMATCIEIMDRVKAGGDPIEVCRSMLEELAASCPQ